MDKLKNEGIDGKGVKGLYIEEMNEICKLSESFKLYLNTTSNGT